jgi:hypothetical protein
VSVQAPDSLKRGASEVWAILGRASRSITDENSAIKVAVQSPAKRALEAAGGAVGPISLAETFSCAVQK